MVGWTTPATSFVVSCSVSGSGSVASAAMPEGATAGGAVLCPGALEETTESSADPGLRFVVFFAIAQGDAGTVDRLATTVLAAQGANAFAQVPRGEGKTIHRLPGGMRLFGGEVLLRNHELGDGD